MFKDSIKDIFINLISIVFAATAYAVALHYFIIPSKVILTGFEGVSLSFSYFWDDSRIFIGLYLAFQFCLFVFSFFYLSKRFALYTGLLVLIVVGLLSVFPSMSFASPESENERILLVVFGGLIMGAAKAIAFKNKGSTGDEDVIATYVSQKKLKPVGNIAIMAGVCSTCVGLVLTYLKTQEIEAIVNTLMYTSIYIFVSAITLNKLFKKYQLTKVIIISKQSAHVSSAITAFPGNKTYTMHEGVGGYSKAAQSIISTIIPHEELSELLAKLKEVDPLSFIYYHDIEGVEAQVPIVRRPIY